MACPDLPHNITNSGKYTTIIGFKKATQARLSPRPSGRRPREPGPISRLAHGESWVPDSRFAASGMTNGAVRLPGMTARANRLSSPAFLPELPQMGASDYEVLDERFRDCVNRTSHVQKLW